MSPEEFGQVLRAPDRRRAGMTAPPQGLFLVEVKY
jgi:tRNA U38,U39,U40 pseudouridine synthase TruA